MRILEGNCPVARSSIIDDAQSDFLGSDPQHVDHVAVAGRW